MIVRNLKLYFYTLQRKNIYQGYILNLEKNLIGYYYIIVNINL
jgi:hypothetical protein